MKRTRLTLCLIQQESNVLLGMKKRGFGAGRWNGFGGKVKQNELIEEAARREVYEECQIKINTMEKRGVMEFSSDLNPDEILEVHIFYANSFTGEPQETKEMSPKWFSVSNIPFDNMWPDDRYWMPLFFAGKRFKGRFLFGENDTVLEKEIEETERL